VLSAILYYITENYGDDMLVVQATKGLFSKRAKRARKRVWCIELATYPYIITTQVKKRAIFLPATRDETHHRQATSLRLHMAPHPSCRNSTQKLLKRRSETHHQVNRESIYCLSDLGDLGTRNSVCGYSSGGQLCHPK